MQFHTDPNAALNAEPDAHTFREKLSLEALLAAQGWYWIRNTSHNTGKPFTIMCPQCYGPFATEVLAIADAQKGGAQP